MKVERFLREREASWAELDDLLDRAGTRPERLGPQALLRLGRLYRGAAADLALARRAFEGDPLVDRLESLVRRGRLAVYGSASQRSEGLWSFLAGGYWRRVRERPLPLALAAALLFVPALLGAVWGLGDPGAAVGALPEEYRSPGAPGGELGLSGGQETLVSARIFTNNIQVTFLAFAGGALAGLGTVGVLGFNGLLIGVLAGLVGGDGDGALFAELVVPHGVLELSCIVVTGAAGLRMGWALVEPGTRTRAAAFAVEARRSVEIVLGTMPWLVLAGLVEGFVTGSGLGLGLAVGIGVALGALYWSLLLWRGRVRPAPAPSP